MEEYASRRLVLVCVRAAKFAPVMVAMETNTNTGTQVERMEINPPSWNGLPIRMRSSIAHPAAFTATDMNPVMHVGAPSYASGAHWWKGMAAILNSKPVIVVSKAMIATAL